MTSLYQNHGDSYDKVVENEESRLLLSRGRGYGTTQGIDEIERTGEEEVAIHADNTTLPLLTSLQLMGLTAGLAGLQFTWTVELGYGTPYLLSIGVPEFLMSLVWLAGPLSGLLVQPIVGYISDHSKNPYGRRRPVMVVGLGVSLLAMGGIAYAKELASILTGNSQQTSEKVAIGLAVFGFYLLDFAINACQAAHRALIVDIAPEQPEIANAYASRMMMMGNVVGYLLGYTELVSVFPGLGDSQMKIICNLSSLSFTAGILITCLTIDETPHQSQVTQERPSWYVYVSNLIKEIFTSIWQLPHSLQTICNAQFFAWLGWFPFLFYATTWMAEILARTMNSKDPNFLTYATQLGSLGLFINSIVALVGSIILPWLIAKDNEPRSSLQHHELISSPSILSFQTSGKITLRRLYQLSHLLFGTLMISTMLVATSTQAIFIIAACGLSWSIMMWAPFSLIGDFTHHLTFSSPSDPTPRPGSSIDAGLALGIHNLYVVAPQFLINLIGALLFYSLQSEIPHPTTSTILSTFKYEPVGLLLQLGGVTSLIAGYLASKIPHPYSTPT